MDKGKIAGGILSLTLVGLAIGYVVATGYLTIRYGLSTNAFNVTLLAREYRALGVSAPRDFLWVNLILAGFGIAALMLSVTLLGDALTRFGTTHWQTRSEMKRNGFFAKPGGGFLLGKLGPPKSKRPFLVSKTFPHALIVAPTGRGKGVGFVVPNLLTYKGSAVVLDVKGENFRETSRFRASMGDKVFRFAPTDWDRPTHRYNPLARIAAMTNPDRQQMELKLTAKLFLQTDNEKLSGLLAGGIDLFVAAGLLAFERGVPTIGEIYRITASGGDKQKEYLKRAHEVKNTSAKLIFERMASLRRPKPKPSPINKRGQFLMSFDRWARPGVRLQCICQIDLFPSDRGPSLVGQPLRPGWCRQTAAAMNHTLCWRGRSVMNLSHRQAICWWRY